jgi:hypothetical protein
MTRDCRVPPPVAICFSSRSDDCLAQSKEAEPMIKASTAISLFLALGAVALAKQTPVER